MSYWMKNMPKKEGWYITRPKGTKADEYYAGIHIYHLHTAKSSKGWHDIAIDLGKPCWGSSPKEDTFPYDFLDHHDFQALTLPEAVHV